RNFHKGKRRNRAHLPNANTRERQNGLKRSKRTLAFFKRRTKQPNFEKLGKQCEKISQRE
ncbi:MAG: hypothetical protein ACI4QH_02920, partial [Candidatus Fimimonas sp.]